MTFWSNWLVFLLVGWPALSALGLCFCRGERTVTWLGRGAALGTVLVWGLIWFFGPEGGGSAGAILDWMAPLGASVHLRLDRAGLSLAGLIAVVGAAAILSANAADGRRRNQLALILLAEAGMLGVVAAWDLLLFAVFWEVTLVPFFFLMTPAASWRGPSSATRLLVTSISTSVFLWIGILQMVKAAGEPRTFDMLELQARLPGGADPRLWWWFLPAFLSRMAAVPLHTWLPTTLATVPTAAGMLLVGGMLPLAVFGLWHVVGTLAPAGLGPLAPWLLWLGVATALAGGLSAMVQGDLKRLLAQVCLTQSGLVLAVLGLGFGDAALWLAEVSAGLAGASLALFFGVICEARGSQRVMDMGGLWRSHPFFAGLAFTAVASLALVPGTAGFSGAVGVLRDLSHQPLAACLMAGGLVLAGVSLLWAYRFILGGSHIPSLWSPGRWPRKTQASVLLVLALLILLGGVAPGVLPAGPAGGTSSASSGPRGEGPPP